MIVSVLVPVLDGDPIIRESERDTNLCIEIIYGNNAILCFLEQLLVGCIPIYFNYSPESRIIIGNKYSFCSSRSKDDKEDTIATPSPFAPSISQLCFNINISIAAVAAAAAEKLTE
jgi:hypothetical protein